MNYDYPKLTDYAKRLVEKSELRKKLGLLKPDAPKNVCDCGKPAIKRSQDGFVCFDCSQKEHAGNTGK